jgi:hypothetical protein
MNASLPDGVAYLGLVQGFNLPEPTYFYSFKTLEL